MTMVGGGIPDAVSDLVEHMYGSAAVNLIACQKLKTKHAEEIQKHMDAAEQLTASMRADAVYLADGLEEMYPGSLSWEGENDKGTTYSLTVMPGRDGEPRVLEVEVREVMGRLLGPDYGLGGKVAIIAEPEEEEGDGE